MLAQAAPGYLTDTQWDQTEQDWLERALEYVTTPCNGIPGILTAVKTGTPRNQRTRPATATTTATDPQTRAAGPQYRLADYLDQHGRHHRADHIPPIDFWTSAATHAHPADLTALGDAAWDRGLYRDAAQLHKHAAAHGDPGVTHVLLGRMLSLHPGRPRPRLLGCRPFPPEPPVRGGQPGEDAARGRRARPTHRAGRTTTRCAEIR
ncbi:hypothetical protein [Acrocarpospora catenulata]|uniref:hypothetical protein n=1 Tax=Acrocarpospora catenulata TaxID=2836182 RepID=UPI002023A10E|nr:hypothetical protein [Acrocarpospora catenulata]